MAQTVPTNTELDHARAVLRLLPQFPSDSPERREPLALIQAAADQLPPETFNAYMKAAVQEPAQADILEQSGILYYLASSAREAIAEIHATKVTRGVVIWHLYNMGYVVKTPQAWRWPLSRGFNAARGFAPTEAYVLSWGERWLAPGTEIATP